jgi:hypothetical protein
VTVTSAVKVGSFEIIATALPKKRNFLVLELSENFQIFGNELKIQRKLNYQLLS